MTAACWLKWYCRLQQCLFETWLAWMKSLLRKGTGLWRIFSPAHLLQCCVLVSPESTSRHNLDQGATPGLRRIFRCCGGLLVGWCRSRFWPLCLPLSGFFLGDLLLENCDLRSPKRTRAKWPLLPQLMQVFPLAGHTFHGCGPRLSPYQKHVTWLCLRAVQCISSSVSFDELAINLFVC